MTTTPNATTRHAHTLTGYMAVAQHGIDNHLNAPHALTVDADHIEVALTFNDLAGWAESINITGYSSTPIDDPRLTSWLGRDARHWTIDGTLPATGVRVTLRGHLRGTDVPDAILHDTDQEGHATGDCYPPTCPACHRAAINADMGL